MKKIILMTFCAVVVMASIQYWRHVPTGPDKNNFLREIVFSTNRKLESAPETESSTTTKDLLEVSNETQDYKMSKKEFEQTILKLQKLIDQSNSLAMQGEESSKELIEEIAKAKALALQAHERLLISSHERMEKLRAEMTKEGEI
jgi:hypothetical protein